MTISISPPLTWAKTSRCSLSSAAGTCITAQCRRRAGANAGDGTDTVLSRYAYVQTVIMLLGNDSGQLGYGDTTDRGEDPALMGDNLQFIELVDEYENRKDAGVGADSQQDFMGDEEREEPDDLQDQKAIAAEQGQLVGDKEQTLAINKPKPMDDKGESLVITKTLNDTSTAMTSLTEMDDDEQVQRVGDVEAEESFLPITTPKDCTETETEYNGNAGVDGDSSGCGIEPNQEPQAQVTARTQTVSSSYNCGLRKKCTSCHLFKVDLDYSKTQRKKFAQGKGGRCRWCIQNRVMLKQPEVDNTTQRAVNTETAGCEDMEATKMPKEEMPEASWASWAKSRCQRLTLGEEENLEETKESDERICAKSQKGNLSPDVTGSWWSN